MRVLLRDSEMEEVGDRETDGVDDTDTLTDDVALRLVLPVADGVVL